MPRKLTNEEQLEAIAKVNPNVEVLGEIKGNKDKVPCRCKVCGYEWSPTPESLKRGYSCPKCGRLKATQNITLTHNMLQTLRRLILMLKYWEKLLAAWKKYCAAVRSAIINGRLLLTDLNMSTAARNAQG
ncbi:hypothetical protein ACLB1T_02795 [Escherichia coli]